MKDKIKVIEGNDFVLPVNFEGTPPPIITWTKNGKKIDESKHIKIKTEGTSSQIKIKSAEKSDDGTYQLNLRNNIGEVKTACAVVVYSKLFKLDFKKTGLLVDIFRISL